MHTGPPRPHQPPPSLLFVPPSQFTRLVYPRPLEATAAVGGNTVDDAVSGGAGSGSSNSTSNDGALSGSSIADEIAAELATLADARGKRGAQSTGSGAGAAAGAGSRKRPREEAASSGDAAATDNTSLSGERTTNEGAAPSALDPNLDPSLCTMRYRQIGRAVGILWFSSPAVDPVRVVNALMLELRTSRQCRTKYAQRLIPLQTIVAGFVPDVTSALPPFLLQRFPTDRPVKWAISFGARFNERLTRAAMIPVVAAAVPPPKPVDAGLSTTETAVVEGVAVDGGGGAAAAATPRTHTVDLDNPEVTVLLEVCGAFAGLSVVPERAFVLYDRYNLALVMETEEEKGTRIRAAKAYDESVAKRKAGEKARETAAAAAPPVGANGAVASGELEKGAETKS